VIPYHTTMNWALKGSRPVWPVQGFNVQLLNGRMLLYAANCRFGCGDSLQDTPLGI